MEITLDKLLSTRINNLTDYRLSNETSLSYQVSKEFSIVEFLTYCMIPLLF